MTGATETGEKTPTSTDVDYELVPEKTLRKRLRLFVTQLFFLSWAVMLVWLVLAYQHAGDASNTIAQQPTPPTAKPIETADTTQTTTEPTLPEQSMATTIIAEQSFASQAVAESDTPTPTAPGGTALEMILMLATNLRDRIESNLPYTHDLSVLARLVAFDPIMSDTVAQLDALLGDYSDSLANLQEQAAQIELENIAPAGIAPGTDSLIDTATDHLSNWFSITKIDAPQPESSSDPLGLALSLLEQGHIDAAIISMQSLDTESEHVSSWVMRAHAYQQRDVLFGALFERLVSLAEPAGPSAATTTAEKTQTSYVTPTVAEPEPVAPTAQEPVRIVIETTEPEPPKTLPKTLSLSPIELP